MTSFSYYRLEVCSLKFCLHIVVYRFVFKGANESQLICVYWVQEKALYPIAIKICTTEQLESLIFISVRV